MTPAHESGAACENFLGSDAVDTDTPDSGRRVLPVGSARSVLLTVLAELVRPATEPVRTAALLHVLTGLDLEENTARQALARGVTAGWITAEKQGRESRWTLTETGVEIIDEISGRVQSLSTLGDVWDGNCLILLVTVPQQQKSVRKRLYSELGWAGFGNPMPGLWASPHLDRENEVTKLISDLGLRGSTIAFVGTTLSVGLSDAEMVRRAWDLDDASARYKKLIATFENLAPKPGDDILFAYITLVHELRQFPYMDPQLPKDLLPNWIGRSATDLFVSLRDKWAHAAHERWREIVERSSAGSTAANGG